MCGTDDPAIESAVSACVKLIRVSPLDPVKDEPLKWLCLR
jgi:hypothetical protein